MFVVGGQFTSELCLWTMFSSALT
uniref:Uncharacterized protein n=1 Tax=Rhizophora mucronata TaxID=61149 RepID=A0A2P2QUQ8_RHIMU